MFPEIGDVDAGIAVPAAVLAAWDGVEVDYGVDALGGAEGDDAVEMGEGVGEEDAWVERRFEVPVVDGNADTVEGKGSEECGVGGREKVFEELYVVG